MPEFINGLIVKAPHENAPDFVKCKISIKREELCDWLRERTDDWINLDVKVSRDGKWYAQVDEWKPRDRSAQNLETKRDMAADFNDASVALALN